MIEICGVASDEKGKVLGIGGILCALHPGHQGKHSWQNPIRRKPLEAWRTYSQRLKQENAALREQLAAELKVILGIGNRCAVDITGDPDERVIEIEAAFDAIRESLRLGLERNNERNKLQIELAAERAWHCNSEEMRLTLQSTLRRRRND